MQIMFDAGDEHGVRTEGLGEWPGVVDRLTAPVVPHMGWSTIDAPADSALFRGIGDQRFYFVHSYAARSFAPLGGGRFTEPVVTWSEHGGAEWIHLVDLDAAFGRGSNADLLAEVVAALDVHVEMSGGIRDNASLDRALAT